MQLVALPTRGLLDCFLQLRRIEHSGPDVGVDGVYATSEHVPGVVARARNNVLVSARGGEQGHECHVNIIKMIGVRLPRPLSRTY